MSSVASAWEEDAGRAELLPAPSEPFERDVGAERREIDRLVAGLPGQSRIRRDGDELAFDAAWEIRAFALGLASHAAGGYAWSDFQRRLIGSVERWEALDRPAEEWRYYERWLEALETLLIEEGKITRDELDIRAYEIFTAPPKSDHRH